MRWGPHQGRGTPGWGELFEALVAAGLDMRSKTGGNALLAETDPRMVTRLLALGATPDRTYAGGSTALHAACMRGPWSSVPFTASVTPRWTHAVADLLIAAGVPVDAVASSGHTALRNAVESGSVAAVRSLLAAGADRDLAPRPSVLARYDTPFPTPLQRARELARDPVKQQLALEMVALLEAPKVPGGAA